MGKTTSMELHVFALDTEQLEQTICELVFADPAKSMS
jgi:hypothetical protein